jgi:transposase InsO family protein
MKKAYKQCSIKDFCKLFRISRSSYYYQIQANKNSDETQKLLKEIKQIAIDTGHTYGKRRIKKALDLKGYQIGIFKVASLMKRANVVVIYPKKKHIYPNNGIAYKKVDNLLNREFFQQNANSHWVGDITYIKTHQGWSYLASVLDLATRQIVGWALSKRPDAKLAKNALSNAIKRHQPNTNTLMFHSDQGVQYCANMFAQYCINANITQSMSRRGNCWDNAVMERFFRSLKSEKLNYQSFANHNEVVQNVESYIYFYNFKRIHSAIGYLTPNQKMAELKKAA